MPEACNHKCIEVAKRKTVSFIRPLRPNLRRLFVTCDVFTRYFSVAVLWLFRGPHLLGKTVSLFLFVCFCVFFCGFLWCLRGPHVGQSLRVLALEKSSENQCTEEFSFLNGSLRCCFAPAAVRNLQGHSSSISSIFLPSPGHFIQFSPDSSQV